MLVVVVVMPVDFPLSSDPISDEDFTAMLHPNPEENKRSQMPQMQSAGNAATPVFEWLAGRHTSGSVGEKDTLDRLAEGSSKAANLFFGGTGSLLDKISKGEKVTAGDAAWSTLEMPGIGTAGAALATHGMKRIPALFHGSPNTDYINDILENGFTEGRSAELRMSGTSLSRDPVMSYQNFADEKLSGMIKVQPNVDPKKIKNLKPSEYIQGKEYLEDTDIVYNKPNEFFFESETLARRMGDQLPDVQARKLTDKEAYGLYEQAKLTDEVFTDIRNLSDNLMGKYQPQRAKQVQKVLGKLDAMKGNKAKYNEASHVLLRSSGITRVLQNIKMSGRDRFNLEKRVESYKTMKETLDDDYRIYGHSFKQNQPDKPDKAQLDQFDKLYAAVQGERRAIIDDITKRAGSTRSSAKKGKSRFERGDIAKAFGEEGTTTMKQLPTRQKDYGTEENILGDIIGDYDEVKQGIKSTGELTQKELFNIVKKTKAASKSNKLDDFLALDEWNKPLLVPPDNVIKILNKHGAKIDINKPIDLELINKYIEVVKKAVKPKIFD